MATTLLTGPLPACLPLFLIWQGHHRDQARARHKLRQNGTMEYGPTSQFPHKAICTRVTPSIYSKREYSIQSAYSVTLSKNLRRSCLLYTSTPYQPPSFFIIYLPPPTPPARLPPPRPPFLSSSSARASASTPACSASGRAAAPVRPAPPPTRSTDARRSLPLRRAAAASSSSTTRPPASTTRAGMRPRRTRRTWIRRRPWIHHRMGGRRPFASPRPSPPPAPRPPCGSSVAPPFPGLCGAVRAGHGGHRASARPSSELRLRRGPPHPELHRRSSDAAPRAAAAADASSTGRRRLHSPDPCEARLLRRLRWLRRQIRATKTGGGRRRI